MQSFRRLYRDWHHALEQETALGEINGGRPDASRYPAWRALYVAALFETDEDRMAQRIAEAKSALALRARELFKSPGNHGPERSAIEATLQSLHALERYSTVSVRPEVMRSEIDEVIAPIQHCVGRPTN